MHGAHSPIFYLPFPMYCTYCFNVLIRICEVCMDLIIDIIFINFRVLCSSPLHIVSLKDHWSVNTILGCVFDLFIVTSGGGYHGNG